MTIPLRATISIALMACCLVAPVSAQSQPAPKDQPERDLIYAAKIERDMAKRVDILTLWKAGYPDSVYKAQRSATLFQSYMALDQHEAAYATAQEWKSLDPGNPRPLYYLTWLAFDMRMKTPERLAEAEVNAAALEAALAANREDFGATLGEDRYTVERQVTVTRAWVAQQRKDLARVEALFAARLRQYPDDAGSSYEFGQAILETKDRERQPEALYHIGRAVYWEGPHRLDPRTLQKVRNWFETTMICAGRRDDLPAIADMVKESAFPSRAFEIRFAARASSLTAAECEEALRQRWPALGSNAAFFPERRF